MPERLILFSYSFTFLTIATSSELLLGNSCLNCSVASPTQAGCWMWAPVCPLAREPHNHLCQGKGAPRENKLVLLCTEISFALMYHMHSAQKTLGDFNITVIITTQPNLVCRLGGIQILHIAVNH